MRQRPLAAWWYCWLTGLVVQACPAPDDAKLAATGLHNVFRLSANLYCGSTPEGDEGFRSLRHLGIRTIISVDGAKPQADEARKHGLRYVHIPVGYDGITRDQALQLVKAAAELPGPLYVHCHHGKHRGPTAAALVHMAQDEQCTAGAALAELQRAGADPRYKGLFQAVRDFRRPTAQELERVPAKFPEAAEVADLPCVMVKIDVYFDHLKLVQAAGWKTPPDHPDLDPPHEALQLLEHLRESSRMPKVRERPEAFRDQLTNAEQGAAELETILRAGKDKGSVDGPTAAKALQRINKTCMQCHAANRDAPRQP